MVINHLLNGMILQEESLLNHMAGVKKPLVNVHIAGWNDIPVLNRRYIFKQSIFHCYVSLITGVYIVGSP